MQQNKTKTNQDQDRGR